MDSALSAVVACLQEIEIACDEIESQDEDPAKILMEGLRSQIRGFFGQPSQAHAQEILETMSRKKTAAEQVLYSKKILVDGIQTSLDQLSLELKEVLEEN